MAYLEPPPFPAPVVVEKDIGGLVADYQAQTEQYRREGREVRLHECRSACTLALSLPNVCVYPSSLLKFHKAYDWNTKIRDETVSAELMAAYPVAVQARLGELTANYKVLTGGELIALGVRDCTVTQVQMANVSRPATPKSGAPDIVGVLLAALTAKPAGHSQTVASLESTSDAPAAAHKAALAIIEIAPQPPRRPSDIAPPGQAIADAEAPLPPRRPVQLTWAVGLPQLIAGAQPTLPYGVLSYSDFRR